MSDMNRLAQPEHILKKDLDAAVDLLNRAATVEGQDDSEIVGLVENVTKAYQSITSMEEKWVELSKSWKSAFDTYNSEENARQHRLQELQEEISAAETTIQSMRHESAVLKDKIAAQEGKLTSLSERVQKQKTQIQAVELEISRSMSTLDSMKDDINKASQRIEQAENMRIKLEQDKVTLEIERSSMAKQREQQTTWYKEFIKNSNALDQDWVQYRKKEVELQEREKKLLTAEETAMKAKQEEADHHAKVESKFRRLQTTARAQDETAKKITDKAMAINQDLLDNNKRFTKLQGVAASLKRSVCNLDSNFPAETIDDLSADAEALEKRVSEFASSMRMQIETSRLAAIDASNRLTASETVLRELQSDLTNAVQQLETKSTDIIELNHKLARRDLQDATVHDDNALVAADVQELKKTLQETRNAQETSSIHRDLEMARMKKAAESATIRLELMTTNADNYREALELTRKSLEEVKESIGSERGHTSQNILAENAVLAARNERLASELERYKGTPTMQARLAELQAQLSQATLARSARAESLVLGSSDIPSMPNKRKAIEIIGSSQGCPNPQTMDAPTGMAFTQPSIAFGHSDSLFKDRESSRFHHTSSLPGPSIPGVSVFLETQLTSTDAVQGSVETEPITTITSSRRASRSLIPQLRRRVSESPSNSRPLSRANTQSRRSDTSYTIAGELDLPADAIEVPLEVARDGNIIGLPTSIALELLKQIREWDSNNPRWLEPLRVVKRSAKNTHGACIYQKLQKVGTTWRTDEEGVEDRMHTCRTCYDRGRLCVRINSAGSLCIFATGDRGMSTTDIGFWINQGARDE